MTQDDRFGPWQSAISKMIAKAHDEVFTTQEIQQQLGHLLAMESSPLQGIQATISQHDVIYEMPCIGHCTEPGSTPHNDPLSTEQGITARIKIQAWARDAQSVSTTQWYEKIMTYFRATWLPEVRERQCGLLARIFHEAGRRFRAEARCYWFSRQTTTGIADATLYR